MNNATILVSDDQPHIRDTLRLLLEPEGYEVKEATTPNEVIDVIKKQRCDLLLMDMNYTKDTTSGEEGLDLIGEIRFPSPNIYSPYLVGGLICKKFYHILFNNN